MGSFFKGVWVHGFVEIDQFLKVTIWSVGVVAEIPDILGKLAARSS
jgi:hypothetical protein